MRLLLATIFSMILAGMLYVTIVASMDRNVFEAGSELMTDAWFRSTGTTISSPQPSQMYIASNSTF